MTPEGAREPSASGDTSGGRGWGEAAVVRALRGMLLAILLLGTGGTLAELLFIGHYEEPWQLTPLILLGATLVACAARFAAPGAPTLRLFQAVMLLCVVSGALGVWQHYTGNSEFEREMYPSRAGLELFWESIRGATPVLAPGTMTHLGLVGLAYTYRHPLLRTRGRRGARPRATPSTRAFPHPR